jgi:hypothetical protein
MPIEERRCAGMVSMYLFRAFSVLVAPVCVLHGTAR